MSGVTEVEHLRAEVARLEAELASVRPGPPPTVDDALTSAVGRLGRSIEILTAILDGPRLLAPMRLEAIGVTSNDPTEVGMVSMGMMAASLLDSVSGHIRHEHGVQCPVLDPVEVVRTYAQATVGMRQAFGAPKAGGRP